MRYLKTRQDFLTGIVEYKETYQLKSDDYKDSVLVKEVLENDITWGGSLLGRLVNSTIRKAVIGVKTLGVKPLLAKLKEQMRSLEGDYVTGEEKATYERAKLFTILKQIKESAEVPEPVEVFLGNGSADSGLINLAIKTVEGVEDFPDKDEFIKKLEQFRKDLESLKDSQSQDEEEDEDESSDDVSTKFADATVKILESIILMVPKISAKPQEDQKLKLEVGKIYTHTDKNGKESRVRVISLTNITGAGNDKKFLTSDDVKGSELEADKEVFVQFMKPDDTPIPSKPTQTVMISNLSESVEGDINEATEDQTVKNILIKLSTYSSSSKIDNYMQSLKTAVAEFNTEPDKETEISWAGLDWTSKGTIKSKMISLGKQLVANLQNVGKPLTSQELIQENLKVADFSTSISTFCKPILAFAENKELVNKMGELSQPINSILDSFEILKENASKLSQPKPEEKPESESNERFGTLMRYDKFRKINEAQEDEEVDDQTKPEPDDKPNVILDAYKKNFNEEDEKKWILNKEQQNQMVSKFKNIKINIDTSKDADPIVRIANIFGDAYRLFSTPQIPSGRPDGRVSQKTWREYKYLGKPGGGKWTANTAPDGPFAIKAVYNRWEKGVMSIIEDPKMRKIFANPNLSINGNKGAGQTLFTFMNDMIQDEALQDYDGARRKLLLKYFNIEDAKNLEEAKPTLDGKKPDDESKGEKGATRMQVPDTKFSLIQNNIKNYYNGYFLLECESGTEKLWMLMFILGRVDNDNKKPLIFKYQIGGSDLLKYITKLGLKLPEDSVVKNNLKTGKKVNIGFATKYDGGKLEFKGQQLSQFLGGTPLEEKSYEVKKSYALFVVEPRVKIVKVNETEPASNDDRTPSISKLSSLYNEKS